MVLPSKSMSCTLQPTCITARTVGGRTVGLLQDLSYLYVFQHLMLFCLTVFQNSDVVNGVKINGTF
jgi:hypothetical protein